MAEPHKKAKAFIARGKTLFFTPAGLLGFSSLITPDEYEGKVEFKARIHLAPAAVAKLAALIDNHAMSTLKDDLEAQFAGEKKKWPGFRCENVMEWLNEKLKEPNEDARIQLPYLQVKRSATYRNKAGDEIKASVKAWSPDNALLDLKTLRLGMGSTVQLAVYPSLWCSALSKNKVEPTLRLEGIRVLKLEQYGAGGPQLQDLSEEDLEGLEEGFVPDNLSAYAVTPSKPTADHSARVHPEDDADPDQRALEDEIPF